MKTLVYGLQYSGKTSVWADFAQQLWENFVDLDQYIVDNKLGGKTVKQFIASFRDDTASWWEQFRQHEHDALREVLESEDYEVISVWWGTIEFDRNRDMISEFDIQSVFLKVDVKTQVERYIASQKPWEEQTSWNNNRVTAATIEEQEKIFQDMYDTRQEIYAQFADRSIDTTMFDIRGLVKYLVWFVHHWKSGRHIG